MTMILSAIYLTLMGICATTIIGMSVVIFPTLMFTTGILPALLPDNVVSKGYL